MMFSERNTLDAARMKYSKENYNLLRIRQCYTKEWYHNNIEYNKYDKKIFQQWITYYHKTRTLVYRFNKGTQQELLSLREGLGERCNQLTEQCHDRSNNKSVNFCIYSQPNAVRNNNGLLVEEKLKQKPAESTSKLPSGPQFIGEWDARIFFFLRCEGCYVHLETLING